MFDDPLVGGDILRLVTAGMYDDPLVVYREYLQNSADSIASQGDSGGSVSISIDPLDSRLTILDDGTGLSPADAVRRLIHVGNSAKNPAVDRGLRGIGRLSALAFAENIHFTTRAHSSEPVTRVSWNGRALRNLDLSRVDAASAIRACTSVQSIPDDQWPDRFFQVSVDCVARHAASTLLNQDTVRKYIGEVCPVPFSSSFPLAKQVRDFLTTHTDYFVLDVRLNGDPRPIERPFGQAISLTDNYSAMFERLETRIIPQLDRDDPAAVLWLAHTPYAGSISRRLGIRGLRARAGNIQIGSDNIFERLFHEARFNGWCVGEIHMVDERIVPNGRRDYFESGPHLRNLENHVGAIAHEISSQCRRASSQRNKLSAVAAAINQIRRARDLAASGYLLAEDASALLARARERVPQIKQTLDQVQSALENSDLQEPDLCESQFDTVEINTEPSFSGMPPDTVRVLQSTFGAIAKAMPPDIALDMIQTILGRLSGEQFPSTTSQSS